jgi:hypothetical protein
VRRDTAPRGDLCYSIIVRDKTVTYLAQAPVAFDTCVSTDPESLVLLTMGRANAGARRHSGALTLAGHAEKGQRLCETLFQTF